MGFRGGIKLTPPQHILVFKYPSRDRVKQTHKPVDLDDNIKASSKNCGFGRQYLSKLIKLLNRKTYVKQTHKPVDLDDISANS